jgi:Myb-like DNA-binding domain
MFTRLWTSDEDELLYDAVQKHGTTNWVTISKALSKIHSSKSCRERWVEHLRPGILNQRWTPFDDALLSSCQGLMGTSWTSIQRALRTRSTGNLKNRYYGQVRNLHRRARGISKKRRHSLREIDTTTFEECTVKLVSRATLDEAGHANYLAMKAFCELEDMAMKAFCEADAHSKQHCDFDAANCKHAEDLGVPFVETADELIGVWLEFN